MDFFKSCSTNLRHVDNILKTPFTRYESTNKVDSSSRLLADLRQLGAMCTYSRNALWVFGQVPGAVTSAIAEDSDLKLAEQDVIELYFFMTTAGGRFGKDILLDAIEGAISWQLARSGVLHVGPWTWLFASGDDGGDDDEGVALCLNMAVTGDGVLYATTNTRRTTLLPIRDAADGMDVLLAPTGKRAKVVGDPGSRGLVVDGEAWRSRVAEWICSEGGQIGPHTDWVVVRTLDTEDANCFAWPAHLCLTRNNVQDIARNTIRDYDWRRYFAASEEEHGFKHPLAVAEDWFSSASQREKALQSDEDALAAGADMNEVEIMPMSTMAGHDTGALVTSPPFNQRLADQQAVVSGIYPTPPDGFIPGQMQPSSQQPSSDNFMPATTAPANSSTVANDLAMANDNPQHEPRRHASSSDPPAFQRQRSDDLFGDMGVEIDFGAGEVGDADFDFFNGGDDAAPADADGLVVDTEMPEAGPHDIDERPSSELGMHPAGVADSDRAMDVAETEHTSMQQNELVSEADDHGIEEGDLLGGLEDAIASANAIEAVPETERAEFEKPLSPFGIKERLLPPPVPASVNTGGQQRPDLRRSSTFDPVNFREGLDLGRKWSAQYGPSSNLTGLAPPTSAISISLPAKYKKPRVKRPADREPEDSGSDSLNDEESSEATSSSSDSDLPPKTPWQTKKRKRSYFQAAMADSEFAALLGNGADTDARSNQVTAEQMHTVLNRMLARGNTDVDLTLSDLHVLDTGADKVRGPGVLLRVQEVLQLTKFDLVYTAQLVSEQAASCMPHIIQTLDALDWNHDATAAAAQAAAQAVLRLADGVLTNLLPEVATCEVAKLALTREPPNRAMSIPANPKTGQPRPPQRADSLNLGPDIIPIPPPYIRVQRGTSMYEMLPPALDFWETLSLAPINGSKDVRAFCVFPLNEDLQRLLETFMTELTTTYESCKLGAHHHIRNVDEDNDLDDYEDGLAPIELTGDESVEAAVRAYSEACIQLGNFLATIAQLEAENTFVVYMLNPFPHAKASQHLCACFWLLCKTYREKVAKASRSHPRSDVVLQIIPIELVTAPDGLVMLDARQMAAIAKEVYDRCPPALGSERDTTSALPNFAAPFIELAAPPPKRIGFQLTAEPASDLMHEGSSLHMAYAVSEDGKWMTVAWVDTTGRYQSSTSFCLRGTTFADVAADAWERTRELLAARDVTWRVFVVGAGEMDGSIKRCWRKVIERPRKQPFSVTLLAADLEPNLKLTPPSPNGDDGGLKDGTPGAGFLTPGSTPQATAMTFSPSAGEHNAPPTPAPSDSAAANAESVLDAHLIDIAEESWGILFSPSSSICASNQRDALAYGALFKRGEAAMDLGKPDGQLPCLGIKLLWTVQVRPTGNVDEGNVKQSEMTLREVLKMYRNLSVLTKTQNAAERDIRGKACTPVHLLAAVEGARALNEFL